MSTAPAAPRGDSPFFVFGPQKCGSSLLTTLLEQHPQVGIATDSVVINIFIDWFTLFKARDINHHPRQDDPGKYFTATGLRVDLFNAQAGYDEVKWFLSRLYERYLSTSVGRLEKLLKVQGSSADLEFLRAEELLPYEHGLRLDPVPVLELARAGCRWTDVFTAIIRQLAHTTEGAVPTIYGEKTPGHMRFVENLDLCYPDSPFIFVVRHPIANIASYYKRNNAGLYIAKKGDVHQAIRTYQHFMDPFIKFYRDHRERVLVLRFEDLVADTQAGMDRVFDHLGVDRMPIPARFASGRKGAYVGNTVDQDRAAGAYAVLSPGEQDIVKRSLDYVFNEFYPKG